MMSIHTPTGGLRGLLMLYDMHSQFFESVILGVTKADGERRLNTDANHMAWLCGSLVQQRFDLASRLGTPITQQADELFSNNKGIQAGIPYPAPADFVPDWQRISPILRDQLTNLNDEVLMDKVVMPGAAYPLYEFIGFCIYREANIIGQLALWRRLFGYPAMQYMP